jgi:DNA repair exonuclease SbcCD ATPase subunit
MKVSDPTRPAPLAVGDMPSGLAEDVAKIVDALKAIEMLWFNDDFGATNSREAHFISKSAIALAESLLAKIEALERERNDWQGCAEEKSELLQREVDAHRKRIDESNFFEGMWRSAEKETIELEAKLAARDAEVAKLRDVVNALLGRIHAVAVQYEIGHTYPEEERALAALSGHVSPLT